MVLVNSKKAATKAFKKLLKDGEEVTAVGISGGFSQLIIGTTSNNRIIVAPCNMFSSTPKTPIIDVTLNEVKQIDFLCSTVYGYLIIEASGIKKVIKVGSSILFDVIEECANMYRFVTEHNPSSIPSYLEGETPELMFKIKNGVLKMTQKSIFMLDPGKDYMNISVKEKINIMDLKYVDTYPGKGIGEKYFLILKTDKIDEIFTVGGVLSNMANYLPQQEAMSDSAADIVFKEILRRNPMARPKYMEFDETPIVTMRVAHSQIGALGGGNILRFTDKKLMELKKKDNELVVDYAINIGDIQRTLLTTISSNNSDTYKFEVFTTNKTYTYFAPATYTYGYESFKLIGETLNKR
ncbi:MAG TPA: hypothetical protein PLL66_07685 [Bacteroidales bacterium]|nr:hypothetical protein [Bacteroidales bacterium]